MRYMKPQFLTKYAFLLTKIFKTEALPRWREMNGERLS